MNTTHAQTTRRNAGKIQKKQPFVSLNPASTYKKTDAYESITNRILELLDKGVCPWKKPWATSNEAPQNYATKRPYHSINWFLLQNLHFEIPYFLTYKQAQEQGGNVRRGEQGFTVVFWKLLEVDSLTDGSNESEAKSKMIPLLKQYTVFNVSQVDGLAIPERSEVKQCEFSPIENAQTLIENWSVCPQIKHDRNWAVHRRNATETVDIQMPNPDTFLSPESYYAALFHEMIHATGALHLLNRTKGKTFADETYSKEELIAELGSAYLCAHCGIDNSVIENSAAYLQGWIKALKGDSKLIIQAASQAQKAADLILGKTENKIEPHI